MKHGRLLNCLAVLGSFLNLNYALQYDWAISCPTGYVLINGLCYFNGQPPAIPKQSTIYPFVDEAATTEPEPISEAQIQCPTGSIFLNGKCEKIICPTGYVLNDGLCYLRSLFPTTTDKVSIEVPAITAPEPKSISEAQIQCPSGSIFLNEKCGKIICPTGYVFYNNLCYLRVPQPRAFNFATTEMPLSEQSTTYSSVDVNASPEAQIKCALGFILLDGKCQQVFCPTGYVLNNGLCYLNSQPQSTSNATTEMALMEQFTTLSYVDVPAVTEPEPAPIPEAQIKCPTGSIFINGKCQKTICPNGQIIAGICYKITCPAGLVWRDNSCKEPEILTTILEIENVALTEAHTSHGNVTRSTTNNIVLKPSFNVTTTTPRATTPRTTTPASTTTTTTPSTTTPPTTSTSTTTTTTTMRPTIVMPSPTTTEPPPAPIIRTDCCTIHSPRLCKNYDGTWVCFNRRRKFCDPKVCLFPTMYLKTPKIAFKDDLLIMPPNPPLKACEERGCDSSSSIDCSGCVKGEMENCSPHCYYYYCPEDSCGYMDLKDFCEIYPNHPFGCNHADGCIWGLCLGKQSQ